MPHQGGNHSNIRKCREDFQRRGRVSAARPAMGVLSPQPLYAALLGLAVLMAACSPSPRQRVDTALKKHGNLATYGDLSQGLTSLEKEFLITIDDRGPDIGVSLAPRSGEGHDFSFRVIKSTGLIEDMAVGQIEQEPDEPEVEPKRLWQVVLRDVHGLHGGHDLLIDAHGRVTVVVVKIAAVGLQAVEHRWQLPEKAWASLQDLVTKHDGFLLTSSTRTGIPDEGRVELTLWDRAENPHVFWRWDDDKDPRFASILLALEQLVHQVRTKDGPLITYDPAWTDKARTQ